MTRQQQNILWIGVIVVLVFLFTDKSFRSSLFTKGPPPALPFTASDITSSLGSGITTLADILPTTSAGTNTGITTLSATSPKVQAV